MLVIRLARAGRAKYPTYRIVAAESSRPATGRFVEVLGHYNPHTKELVIRHEETEKRLSQGAQPSNTVVKLLMRDKVTLPAWVKLKSKGKKSEEVEAPSDAAIEVSEDEAAADAEPTAPALTDETRVGAVSNEVGAEAMESAPNVNDTETADSDAKIASDTEAANDAGAEAAEVTTSKK